MAAGAAHPQSVRVAVGLWLATATFGVLNTIYYWTQFGAVRDALAKLGSADPAQGASTLLTFHSVTMVLFAVPYVLFALLLRRGRPWARVALTAVAVLELLYLVGQGVNAEGVLIAMLLAGALLTSWWRTSTDWLLEVKATR